MRRHTKTDAQRHLSWLYSSHLHTHTDAISQSTSSPSFTAAAAATTPVVCVSILPTAAATGVMEKRTTIVAGRHVIGLRRATRHCAPAWCRRVPRCGQVMNYWVSTHRRRPPAVPRQHRQIQTVKGARWAQRPASVLALPRWTRSLPYTVG